MKEAAETTAQQKSLARQCLQSLVRQLFPAIQADTEMPLVLTTAGKEAFAARSEAVKCSWNLILHLHCSSRSQCLARSQRLDTASSSLPG